MPEPQSTEFFLILVTVFAALVGWVIVAKQLVFRILAACLAFVPAMAFGVAAVNKYYDYYQTWGAAISDLTSQGVQTANVPNVTYKPGQKFASLLGQGIDSGLAAQQGFTLQLTVPGALSHLRRAVYVYLPPQYFQPAYRDYRFPAIELIHGFPGGPQDWITLLSVNSTLNSLVSEGAAKPAVLVMPDANGTRGVSLQCLNQYHGPPDNIYLSKDVPDYLSQRLRIQLPGHGWGIAGYSEGGFCAANFGLQHGHIYSFAGVLSGYFKPDDDQLTNPTRTVSAFHTSKQRLLNTPLHAVQALPSRQRIAQFWIGVGGGDAGDLHAAEVFRQLLELRQPGAQLKIVPSGRHTMYTWRLLLPPMLSWMTPRLATEVKLEMARAEKERKNTATAVGQPHKAASRTTQFARHHPTARHHSTTTKRHA
ncbi:MAG TPA: alpha/beta hydrolase-fold protein [Streptosporangiaceae bacterium]|nr:alpha/beta hydrolase-fold protein [Streptosporangiaceae bacterium]